MSATLPSPGGRTAHVPRGIVTAHPITVTRAEGARVWDTDGKAYLDFIGGIGVANIGHNHPRVVQAVRAQMERFAHVCFQVVEYAPYIDLCARLNRLVGGTTPNKTLLLTTGAEAVENAVKIARAYTNRPAIVAFDGGFHGRTLLGMSLTATGAHYRQNFGPFAPEVHHAPFPDEMRGVTTDKALAALEHLFATRIPRDRVAAFLIEPELGEGGFIPAPPRFLQELRRLATQHGIVLILDEIQTGFGRTGRMFGFQHYSNGPNLPFEPDLITLAKSLAGGLPLSAVTGKAHIMDAPEPGGLGGTYAGNPVACAAALAVLDVFEEESLLERAEPIAQKLRAELDGLRTRFPSAIHDVRGLGLMLAIELDSPARAARVVDDARERGLLLLRCGPSKNAIRFLVPLVATVEDIESATAILQAALQAPPQATL